MVCVPVLLHKHVVVSWQDEGGGNEIQIQISSWNMFNKKTWKSSLSNLKSILTNVGCYSHLHTFLWTIKFWAKLISIMIFQKYSPSSCWYPNKRIAELIQKVARHSSYKKRLEQRCIHEKGILKGTSLVLNCLVFQVNKLNSSILVIG